MKCVVLISLAACAAESTEVEELSVEGSFAVCSVVQTNQIYRCPSQAMAASAELLYVKSTSTGSRALYAGTLTGTTLSDAYVFAEPDGWRIETTSISPSRKLVLLTMNRPDCLPDWPNAAHAGCSWGRNVLWAAVLKQGSQGPYYELVNLAAVYGRNSHIVGWHTWLTTKKVLFNAKIVPDGTQINPDPYNGVGFAYTMDFEYDATNFAVTSVKQWGGNLINNDHCFVGRMHASMPATGYGLTCAAGQKVVLARRCYDDPMGPQNFSWYNTVNDDGSGGLCKSESLVGPARLVPAFKNYVVQLDAACNPIAFDRNAPIRAPDYMGRYRHMAANPEWGDGQPTISLDGSVVAFWSRKSSTASGTTNCAGLESKDGKTLGIGADRVRVCVLNSQNKCGTLVNLPEPADAWSTQGGAYFHPLDNGHPGVLTSESDGTYVTDLLAATHTRVLSGFGGYPILPL